MSVVEVFHVSLSLLQTPNGSRIYSKSKLKEGAFPTKVSDSFGPIDK